MAAILAACSDWRLAPAPDCVVGTSRPCRLVCTGLQRCVAGAWAPCEAPAPRPETCDGRDDDCNGVVDDWPEGVGSLCRTSDRTCAPGTTRCERGVLVCVGETLGTDEICDGVDNDCDGEVDDGLNPKAIDEFRACYDGPEGTAGVGICRPGWLICEAGRWLCRGQQGPKAADCRSGEDNDCDGRADAPEGDPTPIDVVVLLDTSGSMAAYAPAVAIALSTFASAHAGAGRVRLGWVLVPGTVDGQCELRSDLVDPGELVWALAAWRHLGTSLEPTIDCAHDVATGAMGLRWTPGARRLAVLAADEEPQSGRSAQPWTWDAAAKAAAQVAGEALWRERIRLVVFTTYAQSEAYDALARPTGGRVLRLDSATLEADLRGLLLAAACE